MIDVKEILTKHRCTLDTMFPTKMKNINSAIKEVITEVLQEAANNAKFEDKKGELLMGYSDTNGYYFIINKESITSVINKVKF